MNYFKLLVCEYGYSRFYGYSFGLVVFGCVFGVINEWRM